MGGGNMGQKKGESAALEFLTTYGWAFLVILVMIGALAYFGILNPGPRDCACTGCEFGFDQEQDINYIDCCINATPSEDGKMCIYTVQTVEIQDAVVTDFETEDLRYP